MPDLSLPSGNQTPEAAARLLAGSQCGRLSVRQLEQLGFTRQMIWRRVRSGRWAREHRGVILLGHPTGDHRSRCWSAQLAYGADAVVSHHSAASLWGIATHDGPVHVTLPQRRRPRPGTVTHESRSLAAEEVRIHYGLRTTNPLRTLVDLADLLSAHDLERALSEAHRLGYLDRHGLRAPRAPGRRGLAAVVRRGTRMTRSQVERALLGAIRADPRMPLPETNAMVEGFEADMWWPEHRLVVEVDTYLTHGDRLAFERDRRKQTVYAVAGIAMLRVTEETLSSAPAAIWAVISDRNGRL